MMWGSMHHFIEVTFIRNTPEAREEFRRLLMDSPAIRFSGPEEPVRNNVTGVSEVHGICLYPEYTVYADTASTASFILLNKSGQRIICGEHYFITYEGKDGQWYELPINTIAGGYCLLCCSWFITSVCSEIVSRSQWECIGTLPILL